MTSNDPGIADKKRPLPSSVCATDKQEEEAVPKNDNKKILGPITADGERPQKKFYRQRAHCNPLAHNDTFIYPYTPSDMDWTIDHYPNLMSTTDGTIKIAPTVLDIGCGFGGLTMALASLLPNEIILGMEIRAKVTEYVRLRIMNARREHSERHHDTATKVTDPNAKIEHKHYDHDYNNCSVLRTNSMKFLPNYFVKHSVKKLFICFPDPHFKRKNHPRRIITVQLLTEYAYILQKGTGLLYCITDVRELHDWHVAACTEHPLFELIYSSTSESNDHDDIETNDPCINAMKNETEEGKKVTRNNGDKYYAIYRRIIDDANDYDERINASNFFSSID